MALAFLGLDEVDLISRLASDFSFFEHEIHLNKLFDYFLVKVKVINVF